MHALSIIGVVLVGVLAVAPSLADERAKVGDSRADFHALSAIPADLRQLSDDQMNGISAGQLDKALSTIKAVEQFATSAIASLFTLLPTK
jgi:hypothetical protein